MSKKTCEARFVVGDIVVHAGAKEHHRFGWFDGDGRWIYHRGLGLHDRPNCMSFFYVVTYVGPAREVADWHGDEPAYHLHTGAMTHDSGYDRGWTVDEGHVRMEKVDPTEVTPFILEDAKQFIGRKANKLL